MAIRVQNGASINFGTLAAQTVITHGRILPPTGTNAIVVRALTTPRTVAAGGQAEFAIGDIDLVFPSDELEDDGYSDLLALAFDGTNAFRVDAMTSATAVVATSGYSQQSTANWTRSTETD